MASRFALVTKEELFSMDKEAVPKSTIMATKFGVTVSNSKLFNLSTSLSKAKNQNNYNALFTKTVEQ